MYRRIVMIALLTTAAHSSEGPRPANRLEPLGPLPQGWSLMGAGPHRLPGRCEIGVDAQLTVKDPQLFSVRCANQDIPSFGGASKDVDSTRFRGKRVRISAWLKVEGVEAVVGAPAGLPSAAGEASLYAAVGSPTSGIRRDRMSDQTIKGSTAWVYREFVADIPRDGRRISVGFWLEGKGQLWVRDMQVEKVSKKVPLSFHGNLDSGFGLTVK